MEPGRELVAFATRTENRLAALRTLADGPRRRASLQRETGIPRATLSRILADCRDRDLVARAGPEYGLTPLGERLVSELEALYESIDRAGALQTLAGGLPLDELEVDLFGVGDLAVTLPSRMDPLAPVSRAAEVLGGAEHVRGFCYSLLHAPILAMSRDIVASGGRFVGVVSADVLRHVAADPELFGPVAELLGTGRAEVLVYDGGIDPQFMITEDRVLFLVADGEGAVQGLVETGHPAIRPWATARFEAHRKSGEPLDPDALDDLLTA